MSPQCQFWLSFAVNVAIALGTLGAVFAALFGDWFRTVVIPPKLTLQLFKPQGEKVKAILQSIENDRIVQRKEDARYYYVRVSNKRRWSPATQVQVFLTTVDEPGPDGIFQTVWSGDVPIRWRHQEISPPARTIGPAADCDLCSVVRGKWVEIHPLLQPLNLDARRREKAVFAVTLQARSNQADSALMRVQISWDGQWEDGDMEMQRHLSVKVINR